jgi:hypothetical protein
MDLRLHLKVLWRFRLVLLSGLVLALTLAVLAIFEPGIKNGPSLTPREPEIWMSSTKLLVTQEGFPWGRSVLPGVVPEGATAPVPDSGKSSDPDATKYADPGRLSYLATIYSHFLSSDKVLRLIPDPPPGMSITAQPVKAGDTLSASDLPMIALDASATTPERAVDLGRRATDALERYIKSSQAAERVPPGQRVELRVINDSAEVSKLRGLPMTKGVVAFCFVLALAIGVAYVLENLWPQTGREAGIDASSPLDPETDQLVASFWPEPALGAAYTNGQERSRPPDTESSNA